MGGANAPPLSVPVLILGAVDDNGPALIFVAASFLNPALSLYINLPLLNENCRGFGTVASYLNLVFGSSF